MHRRDTLAGPAVKGGSRRETPIAARPARRPLPPALRPPGGPAPLRRLVFGDAPVKVRRCSRIAPTCATATRDAGRASSRGSCRSIAAVFVVQNVFARCLPIGLEWELGLSPAGLRAGHVWTLLTYGFLHSTGNLLQVIAYLLAIYFVGREVLPILGARRFVALLRRRPSPRAGPSGPRSTGAIPELLLGASAAAARRSSSSTPASFPNREITLPPLLRPARHVKPKHLAYALLADRPLRVRVLRAPGRRLARSAPPTRRIWAAWPPAGSTTGTSTTRTGASPRPARRD